MATTKALGGGTVGALVGLVPAVFTFGLSIPIGIMASKMFRATVGPGGFGLEESTVESWGMKGSWWMLPSGKRLHNYGKSPCYQWVNPLFLWPFSRANMLNCQRVFLLARDVFGTVWVCSPEAFLDVSFDNRLFLFLPRHWSCSRHTSHDTPTI